MKLLPLYITILTILIFNCKSIPKMNSPESSAIGISIKNKDLIFDNNPQEVIFFRINDKNDILSSKYFVHANYLNGEMAYFLNISPGYYIVVATREVDDPHSPSSWINDDYLFFLPKKYIRSSLIEVKKGSFSYMGNYILSVPEEKDILTNSNVDNAQKHYCKIIRPGYLTTNSSLSSLIASGFMSGTKRAIYAAKPYKSTKTKKSEITFLKKALKDLKGSGWSSRIKKRLAELNVLQFNK